MAECQPSSEAKINTFLDSINEENQPLKLAFALQKKPEFDSVAVLDYVSRIPI